MTKANRKQLRESIFRVFYNNMDFVEYSIDYGKWNEVVEEVLADLIDDELYQTREVITEEAQAMLVEMRDVDDIESYIDTNIDFNSEWDMLSLDSKVAVLRSDIENDEVAEDIIINTLRCYYDEFNLDL